MTTTETAKKEWFICGVCPEWDGGTRRLPKLNFESREAAEAYIAANTASLLAWNPTAESFEANRI